MFGISSGCRYPNQPLKPTPEAGSVLETASVHGCIGTCYDVLNRPSVVIQNLVGQAITVTTTYAYDDANRLIEVDGQPYTWDANGNLISFGSTTYSYDAANRLTDYVVQLGPSAYYGESYTYNGLGDRVQRTVYPSIGGTIVTTYTLDLAAGLTQVLADGTYTYLYGQGRIAQDDGADFDYFLSDALGSVRQLADESGEVTLARRYEPYGDVLESAGTGTTIYGFTGENLDSGTGLIYLRARFMQPSVGRFITRDTWAGDNTRPQSLNRWAYSLSNPVNHTDPSGYFVCRYASINDEIAYLSKGWSYCGELPKRLFAILGGDPAGKPLSYGLWDIAQQYDAELEISIYSGADFHGGWRGSTPIIEIPSSGVPYANSFGSLTSGVLSTPNDAVYVSTFAHELVHVTLQPAAQSTNWGEADAFAIQAEILVELGGTKAQVDAVREFSYRLATANFGIPYSIGAAAACIAYHYRPDILLNRIQFVNLLEDKSNASEIR